jgi:hypothetical protein
MRGLERQFTRSWTGFVTSLGMLLGISLGTSLGILLGESLDTQLGALLGMPLGVSLGEQVLGGCWSLGTLPGICLARNVAGCT